MDVRLKILVTAIIMASLVVISVLWTGANNTNEEILTTTKATTKAVEQVTQPSTTHKQEEITFASVDDAKAYIKDYANSKGYDFSAYPEKLFELAVKDKESIEYVLDYPVEITKEHQYSLEIDDFSTIPLLIQWDTRWGYHQFKNGVVGIDGCGATCLSMAAIYLTEDTSLTPDVIADFAADNGYFVNGSGTSWSLFDTGVRHYGLKAKSIATTKDNLVSAVESKHPVVLSVREGDFTRKGHYIVVAGYENGEFIINDPFSIVNSNKRWKWDRIKPQIKNMWEIYK